MVVVGCVFGLCHLSCFLFSQILRSASLCSIDLRKFWAIIALNIFFHSVLFSGILIINMLRVLTLFHSSWIICFLSFFFFFICFLLEFQFEKILLISSSSLLLPWLWAIGEYTDESIKGILHSCSTGFLFVCLFLRLFLRVVSGIGQNSRKYTSFPPIPIYAQSLSLSTKVIYAWHGELNLENYHLSPLFILKSTFGSVHSMGLSKYIMISIHHYSAMQKTLVSLKILCALPLPPSLLKIPGHHWFLSYFHNFAFARTLYSWNHTLCHVLDWLISLGIYI